MLNHRSVYYCNCDNFNIELNEHNFFTECMKNQSFSGLE